MRPQSWFEDCAAFGATISAAPNFGLELAARTASVLSESVVPMRRMVIGGERVEATTLERACKALGPQRLRSDAIVPAYGLAEATLAVTMAPLDQPPRVLDVDANALAEGEVDIVAGSNDWTGTRTVSVTSVGPPLPGVEIDVLADSGIGELRVRSPSLADGYVGAAALSQERFTSEGLLTRDLGFVLDGELFVTGRMDDLIKVAGRTVYARDLEASIDHVPGVRPGSCAVVDLNNHGIPMLAAVIEPTDGHPPFDRMAAQITATSLAVAGIGITDCVFVPEGLFPKTPSGKVQRHRCRLLAADTANSVTARVRP
jgi:acyl-CoA synthetase (AMP-forming)/AMP-acid ligase II